MNKTKLTSGQKELLEALEAVKQHFIYAGAFSAAINMLQLTPILYMLNVYDRVMSSGSLPTLGTLTVLMLALLMALGGFQWVRSYILIAAGNKLDLLLRERVFNSTFKVALNSPTGKNSIQPIQDLNSLRQFLTGSGIFAFFDAPWFPFYLLIMFLFHPWFGYIALIAVIGMVSLTYYTEVATNQKLAEANSKANQNSAHIISSLRNAEVIEAMGMTGTVRNKLQVQGDQVLKMQTEASKLAGKLRSVSSTFRMIMQSLALGLGALLAIEQEISPGMVIAGSLLLGKALGPIDLLVANWKGFSMAREQYHRLSQMLTALPKEAARMSLPEPEGALAVENIFVTPPGSRIPVLKGINFRLEPGVVLGIIGPSASGKSSLARAILGVWPVYNGAIRLDGADMSTWNRVELGPHLGYLPQDIELFDGTISDNICRFGESDPEQIVAAAQMAGVHEMILRQPDGYNTVIGAAGGALSGGQRQRIGLARAIYGRPKLLVLDEPNSNLDDQGEKELVVAIQRIKETDCTIIIISHRTMILSTVDKLLLLKEGSQLNFGPRDQVLQALSQPDASKRLSGTA
jgi:ATP-binding cassette subfamily C protein EexD